MKTSELFAQGYALPIYSIADYRLFKHGDRVYKTALCVETQQVDGIPVARIEDVKANAL